MQRILAVTTCALFALAMPQDTDAGNDNWFVSIGYSGYGHRYGHKRVEHHGHKRVVHGRAPGHYVVKKQKVWVPGCWQYRHDDCGRRYRIWQPGFYRYDSVKVWVPTRARRYSGTRYTYCR